MCFLLEMKTDLNLLLECLKYQMDNPSSQKEALVTIYSVCQQNSDASIYFREIGGLMFVKNLAKSSIHSMVKEAALFTLGAIAECNVYCQQTLCTSEFFEDIIWFLSKYESNINLKRMSVYVMLVLVSNNRTGQTLVRETGCISILLQFFRTALSLSEMDLSNETINQSYQLWSSVCSALCACVNNPQNDVNQKICSSVFQHANKWLQSCIKPEIIRPICSFICLTIANNTHVQEYFISIGGLAVLSEVLIKLEQDSHGNLPSAKLAVVVTKTLDACIADNPAVGVVLSKYHIVSKLLTLLLHESLDSGEKFSIILTLGHCTESCEENQLHLFQNNGLPLMIQVLTESQNEELNKAATFVLHNCKKISKFTLDLKNKSQRGPFYFSLISLGNRLIVWSESLYSCIEVGKALNSRNFSRLLHSCPFQCDRHKVILEAEDRYKSDLRKSLICNKKIVLTPYKKKRLSNESCTYEERSKFQDNFQSEF
uniref:Telomere repeat binding bouquet formation protein 1 n=1 Tax=Monodelphis domestica TaxID=13616 RepID=F6PFS5_MONDO